MKKNINEFNIVIGGVGGQGVITLLKILAQASLNQGYDIKTSELHGLSQKGGKVRVHIRIGKQIFSPLVSKGQADLILCLEISEALRAVSLSSKKTIFLINQKFIPYFNGLEQSKVLSRLKNISDNIYFVQASTICQEKIGKQVLAGVYLLSFASAKGFLPLPPDAIHQAIEQVIPKKYLSLNQKAFRLAQDDAL